MLLAWLCAASLKFSTAAMSLLREGRGVKKLSPTWPQPPHHLGALTGDCNPRRDPELRCTEDYLGPVFILTSQSPGRGHHIFHRHWVLQVRVEAFEPHQGRIQPRTVSMKLLLASGGPQHKRLGTSLGLSYHLDLISLKVQNSDV